MSAELDALKRLVDEQAEDDACWFLNVYASEAYLQQELRRLHAACELVFSTCSSAPDTEEKT